MNSRRRIEDPHGPRVLLPLPRFSSAPRAELDLDDTDDDIVDFASGNTSTRRTPGNNKVVNIHTTAQMQVVLSSSTGSTTSPTSPSIFAANTRWF